MYEEYIKEQKVIERTEEELDLVLAKSIISTKQELEHAINNFEYAEGELIDYYAYQIKANKSKLDYLLKKAKNRAIVMDMASELKIRLIEGKAI